MPRYISPFVGALQHTRLRLAAEAMVMVAVLAFGVLIAPAAAAPPSGTLNVEVVNPSESPVPVNGTVGVNNFPASQTVNGTVGVNNFPAQQVSNASAVGSGSISMADSPATYTSVLTYWPEFFTALTAESDQPGRLSIKTGPSEYFVIELPAGQNVTESFPFPMVRPQEIDFYCQSTTDCNYTISALGYNTAGS